MNPFQTDILRAIARIGAETHFTDTKGNPGGMILEYVPEALLWIEFWVPRTTATMGYHEYFDKSLDGLKQEKLIISESRHFPLRESQYSYRTPKGAEWELLVCRAQQRFPQHLQHLFKQDARCMQPYESILLAAPMNRRRLFADEFNSDANPTSPGMFTPNGFWVRGWSHPHVALEKSVWNQIDLSKEDFLTSTQFNKIVPQVVPKESNVTSHTLDSDSCLGLCDWLSKQPGEFASFRMVPVRLYDDDVLSLCEEREYIEFSDCELTDPLDAAISRRWFWAKRRPATPIPRPPETIVEINEPPGDPYFHPFVRLAENGRRFLGDIRLAARYRTSGTASAGPGSAEQKCGPLNSVSRSEASIAAADTESRGKAATPIKWTPRPGYVGRKTICNGERFRKRGKNPSATTIDSWVKSAKKKGQSVEIERDPANGENYYQEVWIMERIGTWNPRTSAS